MSLPVENHFICRTCLSENGDMTCVFDTEDFGDVAARISDVIRFCASIQVSEGDGLPQQVCGSCVVELNRAYMFRKRCEKSDSVLRSFQSSGECQLDEMSVEQNLKPKEEDLQQDTAQILKFEPHCIEVKTTEDDSDGYKDITQSFEVDDESAVNHQQTEYKCENCNLIWRNLSSYQSHMSSEHGISLTCRSCNRSFSTKTSLDRHRCSKRQRPNAAPMSKPRREARKPARPHVCPTCNRTFRFPVELLHHLLTHTDEKPFECADCRQRFARASHLKTHSYTHSVEPFERGASPMVGGRDETAFPHGCAVCGRRFLQERTRAEHVCFRRACERADRGQIMKLM